MHKSYFYYISGFEFDSLQLNPSLPCATLPCFLASSSLVASQWPTDRLCLPRLQKTPVVRTPARFPSPKQPLRDLLDPTPTQPTIGQAKMNSSFPSIGFQPSPITTEMRPSRKPICPSAFLSCPYTMFLKICRATSMF